MEMVGRHRDSEEHERTPTSHMYRLIAKQFGCENGNGNNACLARSVNSCVGVMKVISRNGEWVTSLYYTNDAVRTSQHAWPVRVGTVL